jgi:hypothetical protein
VENVFQHPSTKVFWTGPNKDYAAHYAVCKYILRGPFWATQGKPGGGDGSRRPYLPHVSSSGSPRISSFIFIFGATLAFLCGLEQGEAVSSMRMWFLVMGALSAVSVHKPPEDLA